MPLLVAHNVSTELKTCKHHGMEMTYMMSSVYPILASVALYWCQSSYELKGPGTYLGEIRRQFGVNRKQFAKN